jgi:hypothetical protein
MKIIASILLCVFIFNCAAGVKAHMADLPASFGEIELLVRNGDDVSEKTARVELFADAMVITTRNSNIKKTFRYADIRSAEYSYSKNPRWKTGLGLGAASLIVPPLIFVAIPLGFSKHRRHWLTVRTAEDYAVLKLSKSTRKMFIPAFETKSGVSVRGVGEEK